MFIGKFMDSLKNTDQFQSEIWNGIICNSRSIRFSDESTHIALWGHLYNKKELGLDSLKNDAEAITILYRQRGTAAFSELDGSFTFIIKADNKTLIVRDHHGTEGQVYYSDTHFASSLELLKQTPDCPTSINSQALGKFLSVGYIPIGSSAFEGITKLSAGSALIFENGKQQVINLFNTSSIEPSTADHDLESLSEQYGHLHAEAIKRRIGDSRNVGILLSGGYDSGCNLAALRQNYNGVINSYSIGFEGDNWSELPLARCMSEAFSTVHHQYEITGSEVLALPEIIANLGDPFVEGGLMVNYAAMRMIGADKPDVILGGDGSDQYFGTSGREVALHFLASKYGAKPLLTVMHKILSHSIFEKNNLPYRVRFHLSKIVNILEGDLFGFEPFMLKTLLKDQASMPAKFTDKPDNRSFEHLYTQHTYCSDLEKIINQVILFKASRMASMFDNKIAFPYMDLELYKFLEQLPVQYKCRGENPLKIAKGESVAKFLLKYHYKPMLPDAITSKKKQGGFAPMPIFFKDKSQRNRLADFIMQSSVVDEFLNRDTVWDFIKTYDNQADDHSNWFWYRQNKAIQYFNLLTLAIWWEQYVKSCKSVTL